MLGISEGGLALSLQDRQIRAAKAVTTVMTPKVTLTVDIIAVPTVHLGLL